MTNLKVRLPDTYLRGDFTTRFALQLAHKDVGLATALGREYRVPMRLAALCEQDLLQAIGRGWAAHDASIVLTLQEERAQTQVRLRSGRHQATRGQRHSSHSSMIEISRSRLALAVLRPV